MRFWASLLVLILACYITSAHLGDSAASCLLQIIFCTQFVMGSPSPAKGHQRQLKAGKVRSGFPIEAGKVRSGFPIEAGKVRSGFPIEAGEVTRFDGIKSFHNQTVLLLMFLKPISNNLAFLPHRGGWLLGFFIPQVQKYLGNFGQHGSQAPVCTRRVRSRDLKSTQFLGQGFSGFVYETAWSTWYGKERLGRFARKDFPGVENMVFENEAACLIDLDHPNVVKAFCWTVDKLGCSLVMEFVNTDLQSVVEKRKEAQRKVSASKHPLWSVGKMVDASASPFELMEAVYIMLQIATAMEYLHSHEVGHGDLRPNNILVDLKADPMIVKVVDFGLTESKKRSTLVSKREQFVRTLEWKAPETWKDLPTSLMDSPDEYLWEEMDTAPVEAGVNVAGELADVYSFAVTCTYIMGGKVSYPKSSLSALQQRISSGTLRPEIPSTCPPPLRKLIESSWKPDPERRQKFSEIRNDLETLYSDLEYCNRNCDHKVPDLCRIYAVR